MASAMRAKIWDGFQLSGYRAEHVCAFRRFEEDFENAPLFIKHIRLIYGRRVVCELFLVVSSGSGLWNGLAEQIERTNTAEHLGGSRVEYQEDRPHNETRRLLCQRSVGRLKMSRLGESLESQWISAHNRSRICSDCNFRQTYAHKHIQLGIIANRNVIAHCSDPHCMKYVGRPVRSVVAYLYISIWWQISRVPLLQFRHIVKHLLYVFHHVIFPSRSLNLPNMSVSISICVCAQYLVA